MADGSLAVIYVKDLEGKYLFVNRRFEELFHVRRDEMAGKTDYDLFPTESADAFRAVDRQVAATGAAVDAEEVAPNDDGPHTYFSIKCPLKDGSGKVSAVCGISTDITERKRAEDALRQSDTRTRAMIDAALDAIIAMDEFGFIREFNPAAERIFGYRRDETIGRPLADVIIPAGFRDAHRGRWGTTWPRAKERYWASALRFKDSVLTVQRCLLKSASPARLATARRCSSVFCAISPTRRKPKKR